MQKKETNEGKKFDTDKVPMDLVSPIALAEIAKVLGKGRDKYGAQNWRAGMAWSRLIGAVLRHVLAFNGGEDKDPETGLSHLAHAACGLIFLLEYEQKRKDFDDRYKTDTKAVSASCAHRWHVPLSNSGHLKCIECLEERNKEEVIAHYL